MSEWVAILGYDLDILCFRLIGGKRIITSFSSGIVMGYGGGKQGVCDGGG